MSIYDLFETDVVIDQKRENELAKKNAREKLRYREKMAKDPLFNRKVYLKRKSGQNWEKERVINNRLSEWRKVIRLIREIPDDDQCLEKLSNSWRISAKTGVGVNLHPENRYLPRLKNSKLTSEQIRELTGIAVSQGYGTEYDLIQTVVEYLGDLVDLQNKESEKKVEIYTKQRKDI